MAETKASPEHIAAGFVAAWERAWNSQGPAATAQLYTEDSVLVGGTIAIGRQAIERSLGRLFGAGWTRIAIKLVNAREVNGVILAACEFTATGSGATAGKVLDGKSSHVLVCIGGTWLSAMHSAA
ncbi:MAG: YybH family protein [Candidatus Binataceae bacterium]